VSGAVKVCGRRGLVTFCPACKDWRPIELLDNTTVIDPSAGTTTTFYDGGARCRECCERYPEVVPYANDTKKPAKPEEAAGGS
jgi:hypothetical protein